jgi:hypothetical protein
MESTRTCLKEPPYRRQNDVSWANGWLAAPENERGVTFAATILVLSIAERADDPAVLAFERAAAGVLGEQGRVEVVSVAEDPPDAESEERARGTDGLVELTWSADGRSARLHCFVVAERRWIDREISFGSRRDESARDAQERGRLLGFAAASTFAESPSPPPRREARPAAPAVKPARAPTPLRDATSAPVAASHRALEFAGVASTGLGGNASGIGATAAFRWRLAPALWARLALAGRTGNIPLAQATTRSFQLGAGVVLSAFDRPSSPWVLGVRLDGWASNFEASHLSEDDVAPDRRSRWLPGCDLMAEGGFRFTGSTGLFAAVGAELMFGKTEVYTHGNRVAVVPPLRAVGEIGFRTGF